MLKDILEKRSISVYKLAKDCNLPYTTVNEIVLGKKKVKDCAIKTIMPICVYLRVPVYELYDTEEKKKIHTTWLNNKKKQYSFKVIVDTDKFNISRIHPLKQKEALKIYDALSKDKRVKSITIFGSSTNVTCTIHSDLDVAVELKEDYINNETKNEVSEVIQNITDFNADILWLDRIDKNSFIYENIKRGVVIYE